MKTDPSFCDHTNIGKSSRVETVSMPELGLEQLILRIRVYCRDCKEAFIPKTMKEGFSTDDVGVVGDELLVPLAYPMDEDMDVPDEVLHPSEKDKEGSDRPAKEHLH